MMLISYQPVLFPRSPPCFPWSYFSCLHFHFPLGAQVNATYMSLMGGVPCATHWPCSLHRICRTCALIFSTPALLRILSLDTRVGQIGLSKFSWDICEDCKVTSLFTSVFIILQDLQPYKRTAMMFDLKILILSFEFSNSPFFSLEVDDENMG